jgi:clan AA aspartic protease
MITGWVNTRMEGVIRLMVRGPDGQRRRITAVIDTGYNGALTLHPDVIADLGLPWNDSDPVALGDGTTIECDVFLGTVVWDRRPMSILVDEADTTPLLGMGLLQGFELKINVERRGRVTIRPLRCRSHHGA